jgi:hypothetical protein
MSCRICLEEEEPFVHPCACKGSSGEIHSKCLQTWVEQSGNKSCEICKQEYSMEEKLAYNPKRCMKHMCKCGTEEESFVLFRKFGGIIFSLSTFALVFVDINYMVAASCISTLLISFYVSFLAIQTYGHKMTLYNSVLLWKIAFSIPYGLSAFVMFLSVEDQCDADCISMHHGCSFTCPVYAKYNQKEIFLFHMWIYDLGLLCAIILLRTIMVCYFHMRNLSFSDFDPEKESLLSSGSTASGAV